MSAWAGKNNLTVRQRALATILVVEIELKLVITLAYKS